MRYVGHADLATTLRCTHLLLEHLRAVVAVGHEHPKRVLRAPELDRAGGILGRPVEVIKGPLTGLPIPAHAEIVIEGEMPPPDVESALAAINTAHNQVSSDISLAQAAADLLTKAGANDF